MVKDDWVTAAMKDDAVVVELLLRLKHSHAIPSHLAIPLTWGLKQPRSRPFPSFRSQLLPHRSTKFDSTRCSPSTPLSWTGRFSSSPTSGASDDSTHPSYFSPASAGSKDSAINAFAAATTPSSKRSRKKKTLSELKLEESLLSDDRGQSWKELAALHGTFKEHTANKESFKRTKLSLNFKSSSTLSRNPPGREKSSCCVNQSLLMHASGDDSCRADAFEADNNGDWGDDFLLPDLNMMPSEMGKCESI